MQQPNQSPPGCNPYAVNNKGIAHLLLILLLVAGLSVVGMFLFKMVSGGGLNVMGAKIAANETACNVWAPQSVSCNGNYKIRDCTFSGRQGKQCYLTPTGDVGWGPWDKDGCGYTRPLNCPSGQTQVNDCIKRSLPNPEVTISGWRCKINTQPQAGWNYANCRNTPIMSCDDGYTAVNDCKRERPRGALDNVNDPGPFYDSGWRCKPAENSGWNYSGCEEILPGIFKTCAGNQERRGDCRKTVYYPIGGVPITYYGVRCTTLTSDTGRCVGNATNINCPSTHEAKECSATCGSYACAGLRCVKKNTVAIPIIVTPVPVPSVIIPATPGTSCIPEWGRGKTSEGCCTDSNTWSLEGNYKMCYPERAQMCHDSSTCTTTSRIQCCAGYVANSCGNGSFKCVPSSQNGRTHDADGDNIPDAKDDDPEGNGVVGPAQTPTSLVPANGGPGSDSVGNPGSNPSTKLITVSGTIIDAAGKGIGGVNVNVFLGNGEKPFGNVAATSNASGAYSFRFDRKKINFAVRTMTAGYKPAKSSYTECRGIYDSGYEDCWFSGTDMSGVDFISTQYTPPAPKNLTVPTAEVKAVSPSNIVTKGTNVDISVFASSTTAGIKKVQLYYNPAYRDNLSMCNDSAVNAVAFPGMEGKWKLIGEKTFDGSQKQLTTTITWNTSNISALSSFGTYYNGTNNPYANKYYIAVNVEDVNTGSDARRCSGNPLGPKACGSNYYHESCGTASWGVVTVNPTGTATVTPAVTVYARGSTSSDTPPMMSLLIRDTVVRTWTVTSTSALQTFTYGDISKDKGIQPKDVKVKFINDNGPRDLYVEGIKLYDNYIYSDAPTVMGTGYWSHVTKGCTPGYHQARWLHCNGYFQYGPPVPAQ